MLSEALNTMYFYTQINQVSIKLKDYENYEL
jgi:hypothetical protein